MKNGLTLSHEFVEFMPTELHDGVLYVSMPYATVIHKCCCGCGNKVVTPLSPTDWRLTYDGETVSLYPSVGNWSFACQSHYWIDHSAVVRADVWSREHIERGREADRLGKERHYGDRPVIGPEDNTAAIPREDGKTSQSWWQKLKGWLRR